MKTTKTLLIATCCLSASTSFAFIQNGSFENGVAYPNGPNIFTAGTPTPWTPVTYTPDLYDNTGADGWGIAGVPAYDNMMSGVTACQGNRFIGFAASHSLNFQESFGQNVTGLNINQNYTITSCMLTDDRKSIPQYGGPYNVFGQVDVYFNNAQIGSFLPNTIALTWQQRAFTFRATAASGFLEFRAALDPNNPVPGGSYMALDDIGVVPEPGSMAALLGGVGYFIARRRRTTRN